MKKCLCASLVLCVFFSIQVFGQSANATVSGTVSDVSKALVPGVTVTATNNATGIVTTVLSNDAGAYTLSSLLPGRYKISASLPGFSTQTYADVQVGNAAQLRLNFALEVAGVTQTLEVTIPAENLITSSSSSVGEVLPQKQIEDLPLVSNNVLDLVGVMAGVFMTNDAVFGAEQTNFAGVSARDINVQRDGVSLNSQRWPNGLDAPTRMNPDLVGEIRLILAPVDAEMGRGNGQVQIQTRSGTNAYHGLAVWNVQNSALDSNLWGNNAAVPRITPQWRNLQEYNVAFGGPIKRNKSFFYVLWDQQIALQRRTAFPTVLTDCARLGIFRYFNNYNNGAANQVPTTGGTPTIPSVDVFGNPRSPDGSAVQYLSVFGPLAANPTKPDCSDAQISSTTLVPNGASSSWDINRTRLDTTGYMQTNLDQMPRANAFDNPAGLVATTGFFATYAPDGLNTATARWVQHAKGADNLFGVGQDNNRRQINVKLDHNFNDRHKVAGTYSYEIDTSDDAALPAWPGIPNGVDIRKPQVIAVNFTSTLSPSMVNEARFGLARSGANTGGVLDRADVGAEWLAKLPQINGEALSTNVGFQNMAFGFGYAGSLQYASHEVSPRWSYGDTLSWTRGAHSFKFGGEYRSARTKSTNGGSVQSGSLRPTANIGNTFLAPVGGLARPGLAGTTGASGNTQIAENLLTWLSGSLGSLSQVRFINELKPEWADPLTNPFKIRDIYQNEIGTFFKDDWKISRRWTLNLGVRWDYYGVPWEKNGLTTGLTDGGMALFGLSGRSFDNWMKPGARGNPTEIIYVGPNSPNPDQRIYNKDWNNFGPAVGFAWQVPWFGEGKTTVRGGYQMQYLGGGRGFVLDTAIGNPPGSSNTANYIVPATDPYFSLAKLYATPTVIPVQPTFLPSPTSTIIPVTDRTGLMNAFDPNFLTPYVQNLTLSVTRNLTQKVTLDLKYIGTLSRKLYTNLDLNAPNFLFNGLKQAFDAARSGGESPLLDRLFEGLTITNAFTGDTCRLPGTATTPGPVTPCGPVGSVNANGDLVTGAMALRAYSGTRANLANGNYAALATTINTMTNPAATTPGPSGSGSLSGSVLRHANSLYPGQFPENFIKTNPQMSTSVLESALGHANYHSFQTQVSLRPTAGVSLQATYTFSRNLGQVPGEGPNGTGAIFTEPYNRGADYTLLANHRSHALVTYGSYALPIGPGKLLASNSSGFWARLAENWQASWIVNMASGAPASVVAQSMLYGLGVPDVVGPFNSKDYVSSWANGARTGNVFSDGNGNALYSKVRDPQCLNRNLVNADLGTNVVIPGPTPIIIPAPCSLNAVADSSGRVVLQTPMPGTRGSLGQRTVYGLGTWAADMAVQKRVQLSESKSITVRLDATNVFNHPTPAVGGGFFAATAGAPNIDLTSAAPFGDLNNKVGNREFQLKARLDF